VSEAVAAEPPARPDPPPGRVANRRAVIRNSLSVGLAVGAYGVAFGAASVGAGLSVAQTVLLSLFAFTGGTQFAVVGSSPRAAA
jgi:predicted branched-subunit amino acid permease